MEIDFPEPRLEIQYLARDPEQLRQYVLEHGNAVLYRRLVAARVFPPRPEDLPALKETATRALAALDAEQQADPENELHIREVDIKRAAWHAQTMETEKFEELTRRLLAAEPSLSLAMDACLCRIRCAIILGNTPALARAVADAQGIYEATCDWDRKNRFKAYMGLFNLMKTDFRAAADFFHEGMAAYDASELFSTEKAVLYFVFAALLTYTRVELRERVLENSEVRKHPAVTAFVEAYHGCQYGVFFRELLRFLALYEGDPFVGDFREYFCREMTLRGYRQLLQSYQSLRLTRMAAAFGVRPQYVELDLVQFISERRLSCVIDRVEGVVCVVDSAQEDSQAALVEAGEALVRRIRQHVSS